ncbi:MAG: hypothetical protein A2664_00925 [Candidatus Taylorbacteria bacterium RIFCSPHIGHO2_01_FULL_46_22b]|uniref:Uncharacterized protein n=1 Tax=Candidatus Taylorbacteria bacterium RIFCSPHIGHO2_01_FULL_46_22b TaxID=1802301 RepID=A0A1G2M605_9BACT|nr:MAG: hypothetical protein A2664_00925 [Candidatus Taylorbacteria bacterium RIFCSPHIGHO2_01_FULL_46_22b]
MHSDIEKLCQKRLWSEALKAISEMPQDTPRQVIEELTFVGKTLLAEKRGEPLGPKRDQILEDVIERLKALGRSDCINAFVLGLSQSVLQEKHAAEMHQGFHLSGMSGFEIV